MRFLLVGTVLLAACGGSPERAGGEAGPPVAEGEEAAPAGVPPSRGGTDMVGQPAPEWGSLRWLDGEARTLADLRGRVVLIRFWTETCPFCRASAPALKQLDETYRGRGLTVVGLHHPKPRGGERTVEQIAGVAREWGWTFPVGLDEDWAAMDRYWLDAHPRDYTSVSFLLDRKGVIRFVHPGPEFHPDGPAEHERCRQDYADLEQAIRALLAEDA